MTTATDLSVSLDAEIRRVRDEITSLTARQTALTGHLLTNPPTLQSLLSATSSAPDRAALQSHSSAASRSLTRRVHRLLTGITIFDPRDPDPESPPQVIPSPYFTNRSNVLGIRFERFDSLQGKPGTPAHVILELEAEDEDEGDDRVVDGRLLDGDVDVEKLFDPARSWRVVTHDLPSWIPVEALAEQCLHRAPGSPAPDSPARNRDDGLVTALDGDPDRGLRAFAWAVRGELMAGQRRVEAIEGLSGGLPGGWREVTAMAGDGREVGVEWEDGRVGRVVVGEGGGIEGVVVVGRDGRRDEAEEGRMMGRGRVERLGGKEAEAEG